jgi:hypothetical protein
LEALRSPYPREEAHPKFADVLFFLTDDLERWSKWGLAQADRIDPAIGGAFLKALLDEDNAEPVKTPADNLSL